jgi:hypothetical protein
MVPTMIAAVAIVRWIYYNAHNSGLHTVTEYAVMIFHNLILIVTG